MTFALILFLLTYVLMIALPNLRTFVAMASALIFVLTGILPLDMIIESIDWNVILMIAGTMGIISLFIDSRMPARLADLIAARVPDVRWTIIALSVFAGLISAFVDNVATVLMVAPVALTMSERLKISPVPGIIAISVASNLEGAATLVGDTTSIMLGGYAGMDFLDFFWFHARPGLFWVFQAGLLAVALVLLFLFRRNRQPVKVDHLTSLKTRFPTVLLIATIGLLIIASFIPEKPAISNGLICMSMMVVGIAERLIRHREPAVLRRVWLSFDYMTLLLLCSLFILIGGIREAGVIDALAKVFVKIGGGSVFGMFTLLLWASVLISAFIDNIPYVATMLPVVAGIAVSMSVDPIIFYFGLLAGATLGGNLTPIGASANIMGIGILRRAGYTVKMGSFMRIGVPCTLAAVSAAYVLIWLLYAP